MLTLLPVNHAKIELAETSTKDNIVLLPRPLNTPRDPLVCPVHCLSTYFS